MKGRSVGVWLATGLLCFFATLAGTAAFAAPHVAHDRTLPELDRGLPAVLDVELGQLVKAPRPMLFKDEAAYKAELARLGDFAYEDADGGLLFVASGQVVALGSIKPTADVLASIADRLEARDFLRGSELNSGSWFAVLTRTGEQVLARVVSRNRAELRLSYAPPAPANARYTGEWVDAIAAIGPPGVASVVIPPLAARSILAVEVKDEVRLEKAKGSSPILSVLNLQEGRLVEGPKWGSPFTADQFEALVVGVGAQGDLAYFPQGTGMLVIASRKVAKLGKGPVGKLAGRDLGRRLGDHAILSLSEVPKGSVLLVESTAGRASLVRIEGVSEHGLRVTWLNSASGEASFGDLVAFDASQAMPDQAELDRQLLAASKRGDSTAMQRLVGMGADANTSRGSGGRSPLMHAVIDGNLDAILLLLASGADPNAIGNSGWSVLHAAAQFGRDDLVKALLAAGADPRMLTPDGKDPLAVALDSPRQNQALIRALRRVSDKPDTLGLIARIGDVAALEKMIEQGADINGRHGGGRTAMHIAAAAGEVDVVRALLSAGADPSLESEVDGSAISAAARAGQSEVVSELLKHGGSSELQKSSALYAANEGGDPALVRMLLEHGVDAELSSGRTLPAVDHAFQYGSEELVEAYVEAGHALSVPAAARLGLAEELGAMLLEGADPNEASPNGSTPIGEAIKNDQVDTLRVFLDHGVDVEAALPTWDKKSPLHLAAEREDSELAAVLLETGVDPNPVDAIGRSPLYDAVVLDREETARVLLEHGADPNMAPSGENMLDATRSESLRKLLVEHGAVNATR